MWQQHKLTSHTMSYNSLYNYLLVRLSQILGSVFPLIRSLHGILALRAISGVKTEKSLVIYHQEFPSSIVKKAQHMIYL